MFNFISKIIVSHPRKIVVISLILAVICAYLAATKIYIDADQDNLVSDKLAYHKRYKDFLKEFGDQEYLYVVVETKDNPTLAKLFLYRLSERLKDKEELKKFIYKIDNPLLEKSFLLYMSKADLDSLKMNLSEEPFTPRDLTSIKSLEEMFGRINSRLSHPIDPRDEDKWTKGFTFLNKLIEGQIEAVKESKGYVPFLEGVFFGEDTNFDEDGYLITKDRKFLIGLIMPQKDYSTMSVIAKPLEIVRDAIKATKAEFPGVNAGLTGRPVLAADEMNTTNRDMTLATIVAVIIVGFFFVLIFRGITRPAFSVASLLVGICWTFGLIAITIGKLNLLSVVFVTILIGATIEYAIHITARYEEELSHGNSPEVAVQNTLKLIGPANLASALTTACAFGAISWSKFTALGELGFIAGSGVLLCLLSMIIFLPSLFLIGDRKMDRVFVKRLPTMSYLLTIQRFPKFVISSTLILTILMAFFAPRISFDDNLINLQARGLESVKYEKKLIEESDESSWFAISIASNMDDAKFLVKRFESLKSVKKVEWLERVMPADQNEKLAKIKNLSPLFFGLRFVPPSKNVDVDGLKLELARFKKNLGNLQEKAFTSGRIDAVDELEKFIEQVDGLIGTIDSNPDAAIRISNYQVAFLNDLQKKFAILASGFNPKKIKLEDLTVDLTEKYISPNGKYAIYITPKDNIWVPEKLEAFMKDVMSVDQKITGVPVEVYESGRLMRRTFLISAVLAYALIVLIAFLHFKEIRTAILSLLPLSLGLIWLVSAMSIFKISFNMANFFAIPILIGIGIDAGIHLIHRIKNAKSLHPLGTSLGCGIFLTGISNAVGFGAMMIAKHRGIQSLGVIMTIGSMFVMFAALVVVPAIAGRVMKIR